MTGPPHIRVVPAAPEDVPVLLRFVQALAEFEHLRHECRMTAAQLMQALFGPRPHAEAALARAGDTPVGMAIFYPTFSTFRGAPTLYLEDLYVDEAHRAAGAGLALMRYLAAIARERGYARIGWQVLDWNSQAIRFYGKLGARPAAAWLPYGIEGDALDRLANGEPA